MKERVGRMLLAETRSSRRKNGLNTSARLVFSFNVDRKVIVVLVGDRSKRLQDLLSQLSLPFVAVLVGEQGLAQHPALIVSFY